MTILLIITDLYKSIGGGQTVYKKIVEGNPDLTFYYFTDQEPRNAVRPKNAIGIPFLGGRKIKVLSNPPFPSSSANALARADRFARSVAGRSFDIVDMPDFETFGTMLREAFAHHKVSAKRIVLAMHGTISHSLQMGWDSTRHYTLHHDTLEKSQFLNVDGAYAISPRYIAQWKKVADRPIHFINPLHFVHPAEVPKTPFHSEDKPTIYCIGRTERLKGNDLFIELMRWLDPRLYASAVQIGDPVFLSNGISSFSILKKMAALRQLETAFEPSLNWQELTQLFAKKSIVFLPSRQDTLNLVALEAILHGCPLVISSRAGICDYLDKYLPKIPYIKLDLENFYGSFDQIEDLLVHYDEFREKLRLALEESPVSSYQAPQIREHFQAVLDEEPKFSGSPRTVIRYAGKNLPGPGGWNELLLFPQTMWDWAASYLKGMTHPLRSFWDQNRLATWTDAKHIPHRLAEVSLHGETNVESLRSKLFHIYSQGGNPLYRDNFWLDLARIERLRGNVVTAVTYELRVLRLTGKDSLGLLASVITGLLENGYKKEAEAAQALYGDSARADENIYRFLKAAYEENLKKPELPYEKVEDHRWGRSPKVSVIVSLYHAASKLNCFLTCLSRQTLLREKAEVEVILVDSGSPDDEYTATMDFQAKTPLNMIYVRSAERETIQAAWNRGIQLARGEYLVFLGVDETLYPEALEVLSHELDANDTVDWVMSNSLVTEVDKHGVLKNDVMPYMRDEATKDFLYLDTSYVSWVGGMYRKSIHDRFGYYDESFRAAGDTEFKNRIWPHIQVKFIPKMLGLFLNYPEERTTASSRAEIEDMRAWYIHRTPAGIRYAFENRPVEDAEALFLKTLGYRKSYCTHTSSDLELGTHLAQYLVSRNSRVVSERTSAELASFLREMQGLEYMEMMLSGSKLLISSLKAWLHSRRLQKYLQQTFPECSPKIQVFNDNRYEQHSWFWKTD